MRNNNRNILIGVILVVCVLAAVLLLVLWPSKPANSQQDPKPNTQQSQVDTSKDTETQKDTQADTTTETPSTDVTTETPSTDDPSTDDPSTDEPSTDKPSTDKPSNPSVNVDTTTVNGKIAALALAQVGKVYEYAEEGPDAFDTSGLIYYCHTQNGINIPRTVKEQATHGTEVSKENLKPGDVVFFWTDTPGVAQYVAIYVGDGKLVAARSSKGDVAELNFGAYFTEHFVTARRFW